MGQRTHLRHGTTALFLLVGLAVAGTLLQGQAAVSGATVPAEEYAVYAAAMQKVLRGVSFVVIDTTSMYHKPHELPAALTFPLEDKPRLTTDLVSDFKKKNGRPSTLADRFPTVVSVRLMTGEENRTMFAGCLGGDTCGWSAFRKTYPGMSGITTLSRVGFNETNDIALLYLSCSRDYEAGLGLYVLLAKREGRWEVISLTTNWIS
jgi:hypothetical protein